MTGLDFWVVLWVVSAAMIGGSIAVAVTTTHRWIRRVAAALLTAVLGVIASGTLWFLFAWGPVSPLSLEGAWMWPLAAISVVGTLRSLREVVAPARGERPSAR